MPSVVQIVTDQGTGTAFYYDTNYLMTAAHVVVDAERVAILDGTREIPVEIDGWDTTLDVAILYAPGLDGEPIPWADDTALMPGAALAVIGYPTGVTGQASITDGRVSRIVHYPGKVTLLQTNAEANPGNSGGPVIDECGKVVGMVISKLVSIDVEGIAYAVGTTTLDYMNAFVYSLEDTTDKLATFGWMLEDSACMADTEQEWLGSVVDELEALATVYDHFAELWNLAADEEGALVENDPIWRQAVYALSLRFYHPAQAVLDLLPAPTSGLRDNAHLLASSGGT